MKIKFVHKNKTWTISYRRLNENERLEANGIRMFLQHCVAKYEPEVNKIQEAMNQNDLNIEIYKIEITA